MGSHLNYKLYLFNEKECIEENKKEIYKYMINTSKNSCNQTFNNFVMFDLKDTNENQILSRFVFHACNIKGERAGLFNDMIEMSRHFPEIIFVVNCVIVENSNDNWKDYYKNGKHIKCRGMGRHYNPFDKMLILSKD